MGAERSSDSQRNRMKGLLWVEHVFDIPGLTELYGPGMGLDYAYHVNHPSDGIPLLDGFWCCPTWLGSRIEEDVFVQNKKP
jgi:hypothetical protein